MPHAVYVCTVTVVYKVLHSACSPFSVVYSDLLSILLIGIYNVRLCNVVAVT